MTKPVYPAKGDGVTTRLACCIPHCRRTYRNDKALTPWPRGSEVMCGKHYKAAPLDLRQRDRQLRRLLRRVDRLKDAKKRHQLGCRVVAWQHGCFARIKAAVTERAMGIG